MRYANFIAVIFAALFLFGCSDANQDHINAELIQHMFLERNDDETDTKVEFEPADLQDTLSGNLPHQYKTFETFIRKQFELTDTINTNKATRDYINALLLADAVHRLFSFQFLGNHGYPLTPIACEGWNNMSDEERFNVGNSNQQPVWCGDRTTFFLSVLKKYTNINGYSVSIKGVHTYPVLKLGNKYYIVDPYDPFVVIDNALQIVDYSTLIAHKNNNYSNVVVRRTKRLFGYPNHLVSLKLLNIIKSYTDSNENIDSRIKAFLSVNKESILKNVDPCSYEDSEWKGVIRKTTSGVNPIAVQIKRDPAFSNMRFSRFNKYYLGISCTAYVQNNN